MTIPPISLNASLELIAERFGLDFSDLVIYAAEDALGGWHPDPALAKWPVGSMFGVEGQILYALCRALKPVSVINLGVYHGCSVAHIAAALKQNGNEKGRVYAVDLTIREWPLMPAELMPYIVPVESEGVAYLHKKWPAKTLMIVEDLIHSEPEVRAVWEAAMPKIAAGGMIISHDSAHFLVGDDVSNGIVMAGADTALTVLTEPSDCGLTLWVKPFSE